MLGEVIDAAAALGWVWIGWQLAMRFRPERVKVVPVPIDPVHESVRFLADQVDAVVLHARMTGGSLSISTSGHVASDGTIVCFALHTLPSTLTGPGKDNRR